jgi:hypothetical protein
MAHYVKLSVPEVDVLNSDIEFYAHHAGDGDSREVIGRLRVSKGGIEWVPKHKQNGIRMDWRKFADMMEAAAE